jgi:hypothetical protein
LYARKLIRRRYTLVIEGLRPSALVLGTNPLQCASEK